MSNRVIKVLLIPLALTIMSVAFTGVAYAATDSILSGIYAENIPLGGMSVEEATQVVNVSVNEMSQRKITLYTVNDEEVEITPSEVGFSWANPEMIAEAASKGHGGNIVERYKAKKDLDYTNLILPIDYKADKEKIRAILEERCTPYDQEAQEGLISLEDGQFVINAGQTGSSLDIDASTEALYDFLCNNWTGEDTSFRLTVNVDDPEGSYEQLSLVKDVLGSFHTNFKSSGANRSANVRNGARLINGNVIFPGEEYSFYDHIKPFNSENGYEMAAAYSGGKVVDSIGGGICQVSSTLYNAVLYAELEVTMRKNHAMIVGYVDPARDATISEASGIDFKFINNTDAPIYIEAYTTDDKNLYINLYGHETRPEGRTVEYESEVLSKTVPEGENVFTDSSLPVGTVQTQSMHVGYKANLWKKVTENGEETKELVNTSSYTPTPKYAIVGMATDDPNILSAMQAAVATGSIDTCKSVAASCKAGNPISLMPSDPAEQLAMYEAALAAQQAAAAEQ